MERGEQRKNNDQAVAAHRVSQSYYHAFKRVNRKARFSILMPEPCFGPNGESLLQIEESGKKERMRLSRNRGCDTLLPIIRRFFGEPLPSKPSHTDEPTAQKEHDGGFGNRRDWAISCPNI